MRYNRQLMMAILHDKVQSPATSTPP